MKCYAFIAYSYCLKYFNLIKSITLILTLYTYWLSIFGCDNQIQDCGFVTGAFVITFILYFKQFLSVKKKTPKRFLRAFQAY